MTKTTLFDEIFEHRATPVYRYLLNGRWVVAEGEPLGIISPVDNAPLGKIQALSNTEVGQCVKTAAASQLAWAATPLWQRSEILHTVARVLMEHQEHLTQLLVSEIAKPVKLARDEIVRTAELIDFYADEGLRLCGEMVPGDAWPGFDRSKTALVERVPLGVIAAIPPFNYPINEAAPKIVAALMAGNAVVYKPPTQGSIVSLHFAHLFVKAGLPSGVLNVVTGRGSEVGTALVSHALVAGINFTGSTETAHTICTCAPLKKIILGLSGKDASIVLKDADLDWAAAQIASGSLAFSGQRCTAIKRILVEAAVADEFVLKLKNEIEKQFVGGSLYDEKTTFGPLVSEVQAKYVQELIDDAIKQGAHVIMGGERNGNFIPATLLDRVTQKMRVAWEEPFGPVVPVMRVRGIDEAIAIANKSDYGLQSSIFTKDINKAFTIARRLEVGTVQINGKDARAPDHFPFLGTKHSGLGTIQGAKYLLQEMTRLKVTVVNLQGE